MCRPGVHVEAILFSEERRVISSAMSGCGPALLESCTVTSPAPANAETPCSLEHPAVWVGTHQCDELWDQRPMLKKLSAERARHVGRALPKI